MVGGVLGGMVWYCGRCVGFIHTKLQVVFPCNFVPLLVLQVILQDSSVGIFSAKNNSWLHI